jgi:excisionase family DNA binding protein
MSDKAQSGQKWLNAREAADYAGISRTTLYAWIKEGRLPFPNYPLAYRIRKFKKTDIDLWLKSCAEDAGKGPVYPRKRK